MFGKDPLSLSGRIGLEDEEITPYNLKLNATLSLEDLPQLARAFEGWTTSGSLRADLALSGTVEDMRSLRANGALTGSEIGLESPDLPNKITLPELSATFKGPDISAIRMGIEAGSSRMRLNGSLSDFPALTPAPDGSLGKSTWRAELTGPLFDINDFVAEEEEAEKETAEEQEGSLLPFPLSNG